jgi:CheY-like chemotaxis protein
MKKILLIEDNCNNHELITRFLGRDGHHVTSCETAKEGYHLASQTDFDLIITDYGLPDDDGVKVVQTFRSNPGTQQIPSIIITAGTFDSDERTRRANAANAVLKKPIDFPLFRKTVKDLLTIP